MATDKVPDFFLIGAAKAGTSTLVEGLRTQSSITLCTPKEPIFFVAEWQQGLDHYRRAHFPGADPSSLWGDTSNFHFHIPWAAPRIAQAAPRARIVAVLRDPVKRAHAHWWHRVSYGWETLSFEAAVADELEQGYGDALEGDPRTRRRYLETIRTRNHAAGFRFYLHVGRYARHLRRYVEAFGAERVLVVFLDDLVADEGATFRRILDHVGAPVGRGDAPIAPVGVVNEARSPLVRQVLQAGSRLPIPSPLSRPGKRFVEALLNRIEETLGGAHRPRLQPETLNRLRDRFAPANDELQRVLGIPLPPSWSARA